MTGAPEADATCYCALMGACFPLARAALKLGEENFRRPLLKYHGHLLPRSSGWHGWIVAATLSAGLAFVISST